MQNPQLSTINPQPNSTLASSRAARTRRAISRFTRCAGDVAPTSGVEGGRSRCGRPVRSAQKRRPPGGQWCHSPNTGIRQSRSRSYAPRRLTHDQSSGPILQDDGLAFGRKRANDPLIKRLRIFEHRIPRTPVVLFLHRFVIQSDTTVGCRRPWKVSPMDPE